MPSGSVAFLALIFLISFSSVQMLRWGWWWLRRENKEDGEWLETMGDRISYNGLMWVWYTENKDRLTGGVGVGVKRWDGWRQNQKTCSEKIVRTLFQKVLSSWNYIWWNKYTALKTSTCQYSISVSAPPAGKQENNDFPL